MLPDLKEVWLTCKSIDEADEDDEAEMFDIALASMSWGELEEGR
jgi:hypothetical protein